MFKQIKHLRDWHIRGVHTSGMRQSMSVVKYSIEEACDSLVRSKFMVKPTILNGGSTVRYNGWIWTISRF